MTSETRCPNCGEPKERLAGHWRFCGYPVIPAHQRAIVRGLMLAGATVGGNGKNRYVTIGTTHPQLAEWTAAQLDWLCHSVREASGDKSRDPVYRIRTAAHPQCNRYERWRKLAGNSGREPPGDIVLERTTARVWWAFAGGLQWSGPYDSQVTGTFSAMRDERAAAYERVLKDAGYGVTRVGKRVQLPPSEIKRWLAWIDEAIPGVEHKWQTDRVVYKTLRTEPETETDYRTALYTTALETARARTDGELTKERFEARVDGVEATDIAEWLGGGSWDGALQAASVDKSRRESVDGGKSGQSIEKLFEAVIRIYRDIGEWPTTSQYKTHRKQADPSCQWFYDNYEGALETWSEVIAEAKSSEFPTN